MGVASHVEGRHDAARRKDASRLGVVVQRQADLLQVVAALRPSGRLAGRLHGREQQRDQDADDRNDDQEFH